MKSFRRSLKKYELAIPAVVFAFSLASIGGVYWLWKSSFDRAQKPYLEAARQVEVSLEQSRVELERSKRAFWEEYEVRRAERMRAMNALGEQCLSDMSKMYQRARSDLQGVNDQLQKMVEQSGVLEHRLDTLEERSRSLESAVDALEAVKN